MTLLETLLAQASWGIVSGLAHLWQECPRCGEVRSRWHRHEQLPLAVVLEMSSSAAFRARREGGDVA